MSSDEAASGPASKTTWNIVGQDIVIESDRAGHVYVNGQLVEPADTGVLLRRPEAI